MNGTPELRVHRVGSRCSRTLADAGSERHPYRVGYVATALGIVGVYTQPDLTYLVFVKDGLQVHSHWRHSFTERRLITECRRFAERAVAALTERRP